MKPLHVLGPLVMLFGLVGCGDTGTGDQPSATASCDAPEFPLVQFGSHLLGDAKPPVPYSSVPPSSGWHASGALDIAIYPPSNALSEPQQVSILESGAVVITYDELAEDDVQSLTDRIESAHAGQAAVTPYERLDDSAVAMTAWGVVQRCDDLDLSAIETFIEAYAVEDPFVPGTDRTPRPPDAPEADQT